MKNFTPSKQSVDFAYSLKFEDIPENAINMLKICLFDYLGCAIGGVNNNFSRPAKVLVEQMGGEKQANLINLDKKTTILNASFFNAFVGHILEMDDVDRSSISHPATVVIPAALAIAQYNNKNGKDFITAICAGYEVMLRIGTSITPAHYEVFHTTATTGVFGASIAASKLFDLDAQKMLYAFGNAGTMSSGLWQFIQNGGNSKFLHAGNACKNGVLSAYLASKDFTGADRILEGTQGFFKGYARQDIDESIFNDYGKRFRSAEVSIKPYPCCRHTHSAINASNELFGKINAKDIEKVIAKTYNTAIKIAGKESPKTPQEAKFSLKFCIARTLLNGAVKGSDFTELFLHDKNTKELMSKIEIVEDEAINKMLPLNWASQIDVILKNGTKMTSKIKAPLGDPENPISFDEIKFKFDQITNGLISNENQEKIAYFCKNIEKQPNLDYLFSLIKGKK